MIDGSESFRPTAAGAESKRVDADCPVDDIYYFVNVIFKVYIIAYHDNEFWMDPNRIYSTYTCTKVDNTLFRVPKHFFDIEGTRFPALFSDVSSRTLEGDYQEPIVLDGVTKAQFKALLNVIYPS
jgi:hypothetical protein